MSGFVHLKLHTEYSLVDSIVRVKPLLDAVRSAGMAAVAITDEGNVSAVVKLYRNALARGIKPIVGADVWIGESAADKNAFRLSLLCQSIEGFRNLSRLLTNAYEDAGHHGRALVQRDSLRTQDLEGLIALSGGLRGELGHVLAGRHSESAAAVLAYWQGLFPGRFYIELQRLGRAGEDDYIRDAVTLAAAEGVPVVATNDVCFLSQDEFDAHEARVCIAQSRLLSEVDRPRDYSHEQYLKTPEAMRALFSDIPEAIENTVEIARRCSIELTLGEVYLPDFERSSEQSAAELLAERSMSGLKSRLGQESPEPKYLERLQRELDVICEMGFEGYFLIVADFIAWSRDNSIPVGPGRGSGAGSLVAFCLGITNLDPLEHDLLFERFLNPERVSMPDFDIDFCIDGRDRVIDYVSRRYGRDRVSQIITYGTMAARAVVRDVGRVLGMSYGYVDRIAKLVPFEIGMTLEKALSDDEELANLYANEEDVRGLIDLAMQLEGLARNAGTHAGGVVIAPKPLTHYMPLYAESEGGSLTQLDKDDLEAIGLVKFDFLGLKTLTIIDKAEHSINQIREARGEPPLDLEDLAVDDAKTYRLLQQGATTGVFQLESAGMQDLIRRLRPDNFDDLVAILALYRPGPLQSGMVDEFIERKHGRNGASFDYLHPKLEPYLKPTYGVILYQEQVMQIAQVLAGYSLGGADLLRRAMGKKKPEEMAKQRAIFEQGAKENEIDEEQARHIFDLMEKFAGYGFNKSHSAAYALIAFHTAWLKAHYPAALMAASMSTDIDNTDRLVVLKDDCAKHNIEIEPPNVNRSELEFTVTGHRSISYGLGALKGVGRAAVDAIVAARSEGGDFTSLLDLCQRVGPQSLGRRVLEALVRSGALDGLGANRATMIRAIPDALQFADGALRASAAGQAALFGGDGDDDALEFDFVEVREWSKRERLEAERESLGLYLTGHPFEDYAEHCRYFTDGSIGKVLGALPGSNDNQYRIRREATVAGVVMDMRRRGGRVSLVLDDNTERVEVTLFDEVYNASRHLVSKHAVLVVKGQIRYDDFLKGWRITAQTVQSVDDAIEAHARRLTICLGGEHVSADTLEQLRHALEPYSPGDCETCLEYENSRAKAVLTFGERWSVRATRELREQLTKLLGEDRVSIHYPRHSVH